MTTPRDATAFLAAIEAAKWSVSLNHDCSLYVTVGADLPGWSQPQIFRAILAMELEIVTLVAERDGLANIGNNDETTTH